MADDDQDIPGTDEDDDDEETGEEEEATVGSLSERLSRLEDKIDRFLSGGGGGNGSTGKKEAEERQHREDISSALADLRKQEKSDRLMRSMQGKIRQLEKAGAEKVPREFRKIEQFMGWPDRD